MPVAVNEIKSSALLQGEGIPNFTAITAQQVQDHIPELLCALNKQFSQLEQDLAKVLASGKSINWEQVMSPVNQLQ